MPSVSGDATV